jgi:UDPglucose--hexose-1-phosphate uridylyltransferase
VVKRFCLRIWSHQGAQRKFTIHPQTDLFASRAKPGYPYLMELRKDPITRSWVITGDDAPEMSSPSASVCRFCADSTAPAQLIAGMPGMQGAPWSARAVVHPTPLYRIEGDPARRGEGIYDRMRPLGAHEILVENPRHERHLWQASDAEIAPVLVLMAQRIQDLKRDGRFKYVSVFKDHGATAGQEFEHPSFQLTATTFVPRRVLYELRAGREYFVQKERCVVCDIIAQEQQQGVRMLDIQGDFVALCPYAPRVPYETWILPRLHEAAFERHGLNRPNAMRDLGALLRRTLQRIRTITEDFHLVLHTSPNTLHPSATLGYWKTIDEDYHWHIEILPILKAKAKSYSFKEVYFSPVTSETAVKRLRGARIEL